MEYRCELCSNARVGAAAARSWLVRRGMVSRHSTAHPAETEASGLLYKVISDMWPAISATAFGGERAALRRRSLATNLGGWTE